jgi:hypothetical protein
MKGERSTDGRNDKVKISGVRFDIRYLSNRELVKRMSNQKLHWKSIFASGPFDSNIRKSGR